MERALSPTPIVEAFVLLALVFNAAAVIVAGRGLAGARTVWPGATFEALILTLVAALWFGSLGHGGWVILFVLLGALPAGDRWARRALAGAPTGGEATAFVASLLKYLFAGLGCAWLLT